MVTPQGNGNNPRGNGGGGGGWNFGSNWDFNTILSMNDISPKTQAHLTRVYLALLGATGACATGMYINATIIMTGFLMMIGFMIFMAYATYQIKNQNNSEATQVMWMLLAAFFMGFIVGPGINAFAEVKPELLTQAAIYSTTAFSSFSAVSLLSQRRSFLFLGGVIMTMIQCMFMYSLVGWLFGGSSAFGLGYLMCGLFIACLWVIFDTQVIVEQSENGYRNVADHALTLFIDLFDLFIKILRILNEMDDKKKKKRDD